MPNLEDFLTPEQLASLQQSTIPASQASDSADSVSDAYQQLFGKQVAQDAVDAQSVPATSAADSAEAFQNAGATPIANAEQGDAYQQLFGKQVAQDAVDAQSVPGSTAIDSADVLAPKELPVSVSGPELDKMAKGSSKLANAASGASSDGVIELGEGQYRNLPAVIEKANLPAVLEKAGLPAVKATEIGAEVAGMGAKAIPVLGEIVAAVDALHGNLADPKDFKGVPVPGRPGYVAKGPDIVPDDSGAAAPPSQATSGKSLFDMVSDAYKNHTPEMTESPPRSLGGTPSASNVDQADSDSDKKPSLLDQLLANRQDMNNAQGAANNNQLLAGLARAGGTLANAVAGAKGPIDEAGYNTLQANAQQPVTNLQAAQKANLQTLQEQQAMIQTQSLTDANDPDSKTSQMARQFWAKVLPPAMTNAPGYNSMSASDIKEYIQQPAEFQAKTDALRMQKQVLLSEKLRVEDEKEGAAIANKLNFLKASSKSALGSAANAKTSVERLAQLAADPNSTPQDMQNVYADLNKVVSNTTTMSGTEHQAYNNLNTKMAELVGYVTSNPVAVNIPAVKQHILQVAKGMDQISDQVINHNTKMEQVGHEGWIQRHPGQWHSMVEAQSYQPDAQQSSVPGAGAVKASSAPVSNDMVTVLSPQGVVGQVPRSNLDAAKAKGFKEL